MCEVKATGQHAYAVICLEALRHHNAWVIEHVWEGAIVHHSEFAFKLHNEENARVDILIVLSVTQVTFWVHTSLYELYKPEWLQIQYLLRLILSQVNYSDFVISWHLSFISDYRVLD